MAFPWTREPIRSSAKTQAAPGSVGTVSAVTVRVFLTAERDPPGGRAAAGYVRGPEGISGSDGVLDQERRDLVGRR